ncbi:MAG: polysaccharide deacetylase family protein [Cystobacter sp.]
MVRRLSVRIVSVVLGLVVGGCAWTPPEEPEAAPPPPAPAEPSAPEPVACVTAPIVTNGSRRHMRIALTFDACTTHKNEYDERVIQTLLDTNTPATLFIGGGWAQANTRRMRELALNPDFEFGNHTFTHAHMPLVKDDARALDELQRTQRAVYDLTGQIPRYFRPPFGEVNERVAWIASQAALTTINFDLPSGDPDGTTTPKRVVDWVLKKASPGSIVVMHMNHRHFPTAEALPSIIRGLRKRGFELVTVGTLMEDTSGSACRLPPAPPAPERPLFAEVIP